MSPDRATDPVRAAAEAVVDAWHATPPLGEGPLGFHLFNLCQAVGYRPGCKCEHHAALAADREPVHITDQETPAEEHVASAKRQHAVRVKSTGRKRPRAAAPVRATDPVRAETTDLDESVLTVQVLAVRIHNLELDLRVARAALAADREPEPEQAEIQMGDRFVQVNPAPGYPPDDFTVTGFPREGWVAGDRRFASGRGRGPSRLPVATLLNPKVWQAEPVRATDPVRTAAEDAHHRMQTLAGQLRLIAQFTEEARHRLADDLSASCARIRAALAADREPEPVAEMVERAAAACDNERFDVDWQPGWDGMPDSYKDMRRLQMRAALAAALAALAAALAEPPLEEEKP